MQESEVQNIFLRFAAPLSGFAMLGGRRDSVEELARNLWMVLLAGDQAEEQMWTSLAQGDADLCVTVKRCYLGIRPGGIAAGESNLPLSNSRWRLRNAEGQGAAWLPSPFAFPRAET